MLESTLPAAERADGDAAEILAEPLSVAAQIELFLSGATDGCALLEMLYGKNLGEPVPEHLLALLRR
jgi:hypothetical protein